MSLLIDKQKLLKDIDELKTGESFSTDTRSELKYVRDFTFDSIKQIIESQKALQEREAKWIPVVPLEPKDPLKFLCCFCNYPMNYKTNYCPGCGSKMSLI